MQISWLADVLRGAGLAVVEQGDWLNRSAGSDFEPFGVLWHHTAALSSPENPAPALGICIDGRSDLPGPLCHAHVDYNGVFNVISANRANHAGECGGSGPIPPGDGNTMMVGWEIDYAGDGSGEGGPVQEMTQAQYDASIAATAAVIAQLGTDAEHVRGHRETSTSGKIDPSFIDLDAMRADVAAAMG
ncbi:peptidoglycan recognition protein family protein [Solicola gregarius]|uniref:N-acetylmuramoyl-L-alanine amidase n=1 Tax=Solicola gregarius TaxID=2908642 RepID=A0AA46TGT9_9ACTN|nr:N-acetylmuramoyl-L-alanine amidase [Solicola gregarius]UYM05005.1 N-acetylmuramoyl-L-alanine amidase [Solicola gregarius]